jgi:hypothetical protein
VVRGGRWCQCEGVGGMRTGVRAGHNSGSVESSRGGLSASKSNRGFWRVRRRFHSEQNRGGVRRGQKRGKFRARIR